MKSPSTLVHWPAASPGHGAAVFRQRRRVAGSVFLGVDTVLGPVYLAYGHAEQGNDSIYLYLGRLF